ncbi:MAG: phage tail sheath C-terminal domain-containing protein [Bacteroidota bacterium]
MMIFGYHSLKLFLLSCFLIVGLAVHVNAQTLYPGVYIEETNPTVTSIAQVETAIPAFIGCTQRGPIMQPTPITNLAEFEQIFGGPEKAKIAIEVGSSISSTISLDNNGILHYTLAQYFQNGGGPCFITSIGSFGTANSSKFLTALNTLEDVDEPTLVLLPEAAYLDKDAYGQVVQAALAHCRQRQDRFGIFDYFYPNIAGPLNNQDYNRISVESFRQSIGSNNLSYGAVYTPYLQTQIPYAYNGKQVTVRLSKDSKTIKPASLVEIKKTNPKLYSKIKTHLAKQCIVLPPSSSVAGIYCKVDESNGVWKAPANVQILGISAPIRSISDTEQGALNIDVNTGKSINTIRTFTGQGTLVWGSRTLAGNDNEWRYVPIRRLFLAVEESIQKGTTFAVFEPNDKNTWNSLKMVIESYLTNLWREGALSGTTPDEAFYVRVGLGETMTQNDLDQGRLIIEIGMATVRPAEFIMLRIQHKMHTP